MAKQSQQQDRRDENHRILCLDPDPEFRENLAKLLRENGFEPFMAASLGEALEIQILHRPAVVVTEILVNGHEPISILRALRKQESSPVLIIYTSQEERRKGKDRRLGDIFEFLVKPVPSPEFIAHI